MTRLFITRPRYDKGTEYLYAYSEIVINAAKNRGWKTDISDGRQASQFEARSRLNRKSADFIFFNGHGTESEMCGNRGHIIVDEHSSGLLKGSITFTRACSCVVGLGKSAVSNGCRAFIGYTGEFWIPRVNKYELTPLKDPAAKPVLEVSNAVPLAIIKNSTVTDSVDSAKKLALKHISKLLLSEEPYDRAALKALVQNNSLLSYEGNGNSRVEIS